jgi:hypothetical protein
VHLLGSSPAEVRLSRDALDGRFWVKLERHPGKPNQAFLFQTFDPDRVDVAPGSNVIGEDDQVDRTGFMRHSQDRGRSHLAASRDPGHHFL